MSRISSSFFRTRSTDSIIPSAPRLHLEPSASHLSCRCRRSSHDELQGHSATLGLHGTSLQSYLECVALFFRRLLPSSVRSTDAHLLRRLNTGLHALNNDVYPINERPSTLADDEPFYDMANIAGTVVEGPNRIELAGIPVVAPAGGSAGAERGGEELIKSLDLIVEVSRCRRVRLFSVR